jgi:hypothetical protein
LSIVDKFFSKNAQKQRDKRRKACVSNYFPVPLAGGTSVGQERDKGSRQLIVVREHELSIRKEKSNLDKILKIFIQIALSR